MMSVVRLLVAPLVTVAIGCGECLSYSGGAIIAHVVDAHTGASIAAGATLVARGSGGADSLAFPPDEERRTMTLFDAALDDGTYTVEVRRAGYATWIREAVLLRPKDDCGHLRAVHLTARLQPL